MSKDDELLKWHSDYLREQREEQVAQGRAHSEMLQAMTPAQRDSYYEYTTRPAPPKVSWWRRIFTP